MKLLEAINEVANTKQWYLTTTVGISYDMRPHGHDRVGNITLYVTCKDEKEAKALAALAENGSVTLSGKRKQQITDFSTKAFKTFMALTSEFVDLRDVTVTTKKPSSTKAFEVDKSFIKAAK